MYLLHKSRGGDARKNLQRLCFSRVSGGLGRGFLVANAPTMFRSDLPFFTLKCFKSLLSHHCSFGSARRFWRWLFL